MWGGVARVVSVSGVLCFALRTFDCCDAALIIGGRTDHNRVLL